MKWFSSMEQDIKVLSFSSKCRENVDNYGVTILVGSDDAEVPP